MDNPSPLRVYRTKRNDPPLTLEQLGDMFGVNKSTVLRWEGGQVPAERVLEVERATGIPRHELRPDLYPEPAEART